MSVTVTLKASAVEAGAAAWCATVIWNDTTSPACTMRAGSGAAPLIRAMTLARVRRGSTMSTSDEALIGVEMVLAVKLAVLRTVTPPAVCGVSITRATTSKRMVRLAAATGAARRLPRLQVTRSAWESASAPSEDAPAAPATGVDVGAMPLMPAPTETMREDTTFIETVLTGSWSATTAFRLSPAGNSTSNCQVTSAPIARSCSDGSTWAEPMPGLTDCTHLLMPGDEMRTSWVSLSE